MSQRCAKDAGGICDQSSTFAGYRIEGHLDKVIGLSTIQVSAINYPKSPTYDPDTNTATISLRVDLAPIKLMATLNCALKVLDEVTTSAIGGYVGIRVPATSVEVTLQFGTCASSVDFLPVVDAIEIDGSPILDLDLCVPNAPRSRMEMHLALTLDGPLCIARVAA